MIQHDCYGEALRIIIDFAIDKHRHAERVVDVRTELSDLRDELNSFDHRTLQWLHDRMAVAFRMDYYLNADLFAHAAQNSHTPAEINNLWFDFLRRELARVFANHLELPRLILTAALYPNLSPKGSDAEDELYRLTKILYSELE
ncbi:hypothetical protein [Psychrobacter sp.]